MEKKLPRDIREYWEGYGEKKYIYPQIKTGKISVKLLCLRYVYSSRIVKSFLILRNLETPSCMDSRRDIQEHIQANGERGDIFGYKVDRSFLRNYFVMYAFRSGIYTFFRTRQCLHTFPVKPKK